MRISCSGRAKSVSRCEACAETGVRARFLVGRFERGSADTGIDSGPVPDMVGGELALAGIVCVFPYRAMKFVVCLALPWYKRWAPR